jgi:hypothetical protein
MVLGQIIEVAAYSKAELVSFCVLRPKNSFC